MNIVPSHKAAKEPMYLPNFEREYVVVCVQLIEIPMAIRTADVVPVLF